MTMHRLNAVWKLVLSISFVYVGAASSAELAVFSATGMRPVLAELVPGFERTTGHKVAIDYDASGGLKRGSRPERRST